MTMQKVVAHYGGREFTDGATIPFFVNIDGEHKKIGEGKFDHKNSFVEVEVDPETEEGKLLLAGIFKNNIRSMSIDNRIRNNGENED